MASDENAERIVRRVKRALDAAGIPHMLTGSLASSTHGSPRTTQDVDIVIAPTRESLERLLEEFPHDDCYVSREAAQQALDSEGKFNVIDMTAGWKIGFIVRRSRPFSETEFGRRHEAEVLGSTMFVASAEDVVVSKLEWAKRGESERQLRDVAGILRTQGESLDRAYVERWVVPLALEQQWQRAREIAGD